MQLDSVVSRSLQVLRCVRPALNETFNVLLRGSARLSKRHAHRIALQLHRRRRDGMRLQLVLHLPPRMTNLPNKQTPLLRSLRRHLFKRFKPLALERRISRDNRISPRLQVDVVDENVARQHHAVPAFAPAFVHVDQLFGRHAAHLGCFGVPGGDALCHGGFHEAVGGCAAAEGEGEGFA